MATLEDLITANTAALERNSSLLERVVAGQEAAIAKLDGGATRAPRTSRSAKSTDTAETPAPATAETGAATATDPAPATVETPAPAATETAAPATVNVATIAAGITDAASCQAFISGWTGGTEDAAERAARVELLKAIAASLGVAPKFAELVPHATKVVFLIERAKALGTTQVDPKAAYNFDGDVSQTVEAGGSDF